MGERAVPEADQSTQTPEHLRPLGRLGPAMAGIWLVFLYDPVRTGWQQRHTVHGLVGLVLTVVFGLIYLGVWIRFRQRRVKSLEMRATGAEASVWFVSLCLLAVGTILALGEIGGTTLVYLAVAALVLYGFRVAVVITVGLTVAVVVVSAVRGWGSPVGNVFALWAAFLAVYGITSMMNRNIALIRAQNENARLAVENERTRFARDLHDILGHSLTVITVKAELAGRLLDADSAEATTRARAEVADLERLSRDALADVRRAVEGYRDLTLPGELARARIALESAGIRAEIPQASEEVPGELRELFAWVVREGVTNVIRHSGARSCVIEVDAARVEIRDDGRGARDTTPGSGLRGLRERAAATGGTLVTRSLAPGYALAVTVQPRAPNGGR